MPIAFAIHELINRAEDLTTLLSWIGLETDLVVQSLCLKHRYDVRQGTLVSILLIKESDLMLSRFRIVDCEIKIRRRRRLVIKTTVGCILRLIARRASEKTTTRKADNRGENSVHH